MKDSLKTGLCFGLTSGVITTLGLLVGLNASTHLKAVVIGGILTIAIADAFSDALGIHLAEESKSHNSEQHVWESTIATFLTKFFCALTFILPVLFFSLETAVIINIFWGLLLLSGLSFHIAKNSGTKPIKVISEHLAIAIVVIAITHILGDWINKTLY